MAVNRPRGSREKHPEPDSPRKKGKLNNMEMLGIGLFFLAICLYGLSKCGKEDVPAEAIVTEEVVDSTTTDSTNTTEEEGSSFSDGGDRATTTTTVVPNTAAAKLYIIIDSLKMRSGPRLDSVVVDYLKYGEAVTDLGERTPLQKIRISVDEVRTAPWVKVKTSKGKVGWAFGAGLQFYPVATTTNLQEGSN